MMPRIAVLISDLPGSGLDERARALFARLPERFDATLVCHRGNRFARARYFYDALVAARPDVIYVVDPIYAAVAATWLYRATHSAHVVVDTGDLVYELAKETGRSGWLALAIVRWAEQTGLRLADAIVVRSSVHRDLFIARGGPTVVAIPDGVDLAQFYPMDARAWREQIGVRRDEILVGGVGTMPWNPRRHFCFGWDLIEALPRLRDLPVRGLLIGDGDGRAKLETRARELGVSDRVIFTGRIPYADLPRAINALDICLLTQMNSLISWIRTTGKLPLYLACDRYVIATAVGAAAELLEPLDMLLPYEGLGRDPNHPARLAAKIRGLVERPERLQLKGRGVEIARQNFDYDRLAITLTDLLEHL
jgi:glycosyltransferase involved in cell wall biosynthesis